MIDITAVHMVAGGTRHEHIQSVQWRNPQTAETGQSTREQVVSWLRASNTNRAFVIAAGRRVEVHVVNASPPYIQTYADAVWQDNLLALPRY